jgi:uncharacterized protein YdaU (DUF1376 family)
VAKKLPYYPMFVDEFDFDEEVIAMSVLEVGLYILALNSAWRNGSIPDTDVGLNKILRRNPAEIKKAWPVVRQRFVQAPGESGRLINPRQEIERVRAVEKSNQNSRNAKSHRARKADAGEEFEIRKASAERPLSDEEISSERPSAENNGFAQTHASGLFSSQSKSSSSEGLYSETSIALATERDMFEEFIGAFLAAGVKLNEEDLVAAAKGNSDSPGFLSLSPETQQIVVDFVTEKARHTEARYMGLPVNFLAKGEWRRRGGPRTLPNPSRNKVERAQEEAARMFMEGK